MRHLLIGLTALAALSLTACSGGITKLSVLDRDETPRTAALAVSADVTPALEDVALLCEAGVLSPDTKAAIATHGPKLVDVATRYFESAEACVVIDGALQSDTSTAGNCQRGTVREVSRLLPSELAKASTAFGLGNDVGRGLFLASIVTRRIVGNTDGGAVDGFAKDDDLSAAEYAAALAPLRAARDRVA
ncbi:MAG: hypothetical protein WA989_06210, partial [Henriciella sp.]|uniref:hypothetical protein n=1 Tax=Henriciella sp. TaxID=1968823 RepID=UPI003C73DF65